MSARRWLRVPALGSVALAASLVSSCGSSPPSGPTSVFLTIQNGTHAGVPDQLRLTAGGDDGTIFENVQLPTSGTLVLPSGGGDGAVLGTLTLYVAASTHSLDIDVRGYASQALLSEGTTSVSVVAGRQVAARVVLQPEIADGGRDGSSADGPDAAGMGAVDARQDSPIDVTGAGGSGAGGSGAGGASGTGGAITDAAASDVRPSGTGGAGVGGAGTGGRGTGGAGTGGALMDAGADTGPSCTARFNFENGGLYGAVLDTTAPYAGFTSFANTTDAYCGNGALRIAANLTTQNNIGEVVIPLGQTADLSGKTLSVAMKSAPATPNLVFVIFLVPSYLPTIAFSPLPGTYATMTMVLPTGADAGTRMTTGISIQAIRQTVDWAGVIDVDELDVR